MPIAEAMASGLAVVVTGGGAADDFCDADTGWIIPSRRVDMHPGDWTPTGAGTWWLEPDRQALAAAMVEVLGDPDKVRHRGGVARARIVERFSWDVVAACRRGPDCGTARWGCLHLGAARARPTVTTAPAADPLVADRAPGRGDPHVSTTEVPTTSPTRRFGRSGTRADFARRVDRPSPGEGSPSLVRRCRTARRPSTRYPGAELIIVDDGGSQEVRVAVAPVRGRVRFVHNLAPRGTRGAQATGAALASGLIIVLVDPRQRLESRWLDAVCRPFDVDPGHRDGRGP